MTDIAEPDGLLGSRRIRRHLGWTLLSGLALPLSALITGPLLARTIGADGRGLIAAVVAPASVAATVSIAALPRSAVYHLAGSMERYREVARESLRLAFLGGVLGALGWLALSGVFLDGVPHRAVVRAVVVLLIPLAALGSVSVGLLGSIGRFRTMNVANASSALARLLVLVGLAVAEVLTVSTALLGFLVYEAGLATLQLGPVLAHFRRSDHGPGSGIRRPIIRYWASGWIGDVSGVAVRRLDIVILAALVSPEELGYYVLAVSLAGVWALAVASLQRVVLPETRRTHDFGAVARLHRMLLTLTVGLIVGSFLFADAATQLLYGSGFEETARLFPVLLLGLGPVALLPLTSSVLDAVGAPGVRSLVRVVTAIVTVIGLAIAVPLAGVWGAAWTSVGSYLLAAGLTIVLAAHFGKIPASAFLIPRRGDLDGLRSVRGEDT